MCFKLLVINYHNVIKSDIIRAKKHIKYKTEDYIHIFVIFKLHYQGTLPSFLCEFLGFDKM